MTCDLCKKELEAANSEFSNVDGLLLCETCMEKIEWTCTSRHASRKHPAGRIVSIKEIKGYTVIFMLCSCGAEFETVLDKIQ